MIYKSFYAIEIQFGRPLTLFFFILPFALLKIKHTLIDPERFKHEFVKQVQRLIAGSPHLLVEDNGHVVKPPKVTPMKKIPLEYVVKSTLNIPKQKFDLEKPNDETEFSGENAVGKASLSSVQNGSQTTNCRRPSEPNMGRPWNYNPPPGHHQWLIPVMSPSEGLVYKPYPAPGFMSPVYGGGCGPPGSMPPMMGKYKCLLTFSLFVIFMSFFPFKY